MTSTASPAPLALTFASGDGLISPYLNALEFAGESGRVATMADIVDARISSDFGAAVWRNWFTTLSAEYYGLSAGGVPMLVVAHGVGPMSDKDGIVSAYSYQFKDKTRSREGGRIPMPVFRKLLEGGFGEVHVIEMDRFLEVSDEYPFSSMTPEDLLRNPLWIARLGGQSRAEAYVAHHAALAKAERSARSLEGGGGEKDAGRIVRMKDPDVGYLHFDWPGGGKPVLRKPRVDHLDDGAVAHLLSTGQLFDVHESGDRIPSAQVEIGVQGWRDYAKLVGVRGAGTVREILPPVSRSNAIIKQPELLWVPHEGAAASHDGFGPLVRLGDKWFTQYPKEGETMDTGSAMHEVVSYEPMGEPVILTTSGMFFFRYGLNEARVLAPDGANAYHLVGDVYAPRENEMAVRLQFAKVVVDRSARLMTEKEMNADVGLLARLAGAS